MRSLSIYVFTIMLFAATGLGASSQAQELFGVGTNFEDAAPAGVTARLVAPSSLYSIDPDTGAVTFIGDIGVDDCTGLDFHPITNELFAVCFDIFDDEYVLVKVNPATGAGTTVGPLNSAVPFGDPTDISFRSDGILFANLRSKPANVLGVINTRTGNFTEIGDTGIFFSRGGLGFSLPDILFYAGFDLGGIDLFTLSQQSGDASFVSDLFVIPPTRIIVESLETDPGSGEFFIAYQDGEDGSVLGTVNPDSGLVSRIGPTDGIFIRAIAFPNPVVSSIPTLSEYGLILSAVVLLGASLLVLRRRSYKSEA